ncbi:MAG: alcohol dehydrogenase catalytic domain-containing protein [Planctomycetes bacterium]|nr:alcohol dehydrogenase catalytic domain-containing protein [Planctomycetota bacterium]
MKAAVFKEVGTIEITDIPMPACEPGGIVIKVGACAVCGTDVKVYHHGHKHIVPPRVTGHELSGEIAEVGKDVKGYNVGDRVAVAPAVPCGECHYCLAGLQSMCDNLIAIGYACDGGFAEYMAVPPIAVRNGCVNFIPEGVSLEEAALAEPLACTINAAELTHTGIGQTVVVVGAGPIGCLHIMLSKALGATQTILIDISEERLDMSKMAQADLTINSAKADPIEAVKDATGGRGAEVVITACSVGVVQEQALEMVAKRGYVNFFGGLPKDNPYIKFNSNLLHYGEFYCVGTHGSAPRHNMLALALLGAGKIKTLPLISHRLPIPKLLEGIEITEKAQGLRVIIAGT